MDTKLFWLLLFAVSCGIASGALQRVFPPSSVQYSCPCPCLNLSCSFTEGATAVVWSFPGLVSIPDDYPGHTIDNSVISSGVSYLFVRSSSVMKTEYSCIAFYERGDPEENDPLPSPPEAELSVSYTHGPVNVDSIVIKWDRLYPECFSYFVSLDGMLMTTNPPLSNHTFSDLSQATTYNVCVIAMDGHSNQRTEWMHCENITTATEPTTNTVDVIRIGAGTAAACGVAVFLVVFFCILAICCSKSVHRRQGKVVHDETHQKPSTKGNPKGNSEEC